MAHTIQVKTQVFDGIRTDGHNSFLVALADDAQQHQFGIDGRDGQARGFTHPQPASVHRGQAGAIDRMTHRGDQRAAIGTAAGVGQTLLTR